MDEKIQVEIPIVLIGTPTGVKDKGGVMDHQLRELKFLPAGQHPQEGRDRRVEPGHRDSIHVSDIGSST